MNKKNTLLINLIGGPGIGKSTLSAFLYVQMKLKHMHVEYVQEVAKPLVYLEKWNEINCQLELTNSQFEKFEAYNGQVDFIVTDGSILHGLYFNRNNPDNTSDVEKVESRILELHHSIPTLNIILTRPKDLEYIQEGRLQDEKESHFIDKYLEKTLIDFDIEYLKIEADILHMLGLLEYIDKKYKSINKSNY